MSKSFILPGFELVPETKLIEEKKHKSKISLKNLVIITATAILFIWLLVIYLFASMCTDLSMKILPEKYFSKVLIIDPMGNLENAWHYTKGPL